MQPVAILPAEEYAVRRRTLLERLGADAVALVPAAGETLRNRDTHHPFRQDSDFQYLTGFPEPDALAVLAPGAEAEYELFVRERNPEMETWNGRRAGPEGAVARYGAGRAHTLAALDERLPELLANRKRIYYALGRNPEFDRRVLGWLERVRARSRQGVRAPVELCELGTLLHELRLFKRPAEVELLRRAATITAEGHCRAMQACRPGLYEYQLEAELLYTFTRSGAGWAYPSIVGGGDNATILHYVENNAPLRDGELVLIDAGCEVDGYCADITRTFPVNGRFSGEQRALYEVVLAAQHAALAEVRPGRPWQAFHDAAVKVLSEGLVELGILQGDPAERIADESYRRFYMHRTGHWLGLDVHDVGDYRDPDGQWRALQPGMVLTVEPGLYIASGNQGVDERWWGLGIRIEDDVLVTADGHEILTAGVPKAVDDIEALMRAAR
ncbi:MAG TPA: Xaa-Pro aminopeptidase [Candidatus Competibacteraceae bacterium]|nr:Xaa-Pro aminopeptidase [Candidatus Competibacteraceae bacterium]